MSTTAPTSPAGGTEHQPDFYPEVARVIERIRPAVQADGGDVELAGVSPDGVVQIRLKGACVGCPSSTITLHMGIERNLREKVPQVTGVVQVR